MAEKIKATLTDYLLCRVITGEDNDKEIYRLLEQGEMFLKEYGIGSKTKAEYYDKEELKEDVDMIYSAYPAKDVNNNGRLTGKGSRCKILIKSLLKKGVSRGHIMRAIEWRKLQTGWLPNFETFLNNLPTIEDIENDAPQNNVVKPLNSLNGGGINF